MEKITKLPGFFQSFLKILVQNNFLRQMTVLPRLIVIIYISF